MRDRERLLRLVENDANGSLKATLSVLKSDVAALFAEFMDFSELDLTVERDDDGQDLYVRARVNKFYAVGKTTERE